MFKKVVFILSALLLAFKIANAAVVKAEEVKIVPFSLYSQAREKLDQLSEVVRSAIATATHHIEGDRTEFKKYADDKQSSAEVELDDEASKINGDIDVLHNLANSAGVNVNFCFRAPDLEDVLTRVLGDLQECITDASKQVDEKITDSSRIVQQTLATVDDLETQLEACTSGSILCVSPVVTQIDAATIELPELIESELRTLDRNVEILTLETDQCSSVQISTYVTDANAILKDVSECVDKNI